MVNNPLPGCRFRLGSFDCSVRQTPFSEATPMKYMLLIYMEEDALNEAERKDCYVKSTQLAHELKSNGKYLAANPLQSIATATSVRIRNEKPIVTDGPFAETREQLGGYFLIDAQDL